MDTTEFQKCFPAASPAGVRLYALPFIQAMAEFKIDTPKRQAMFLAQVAHESGELHFTEEDLNYTAQALLKIFPRDFKRSEAPAYAHQPEKIANRAYAHQNGNGSEMGGDGWCYHGRGPIQITGRDNYRHYGGLLKLDLLNHPDLLALPANGARSAAAFWSDHNLNAIADLWTRHAFGLTTEKINGGQNGAADRWAHLVHICGVLGLKPPL